MKSFFYKVNNQEYEVIIIQKRIRNYHYRFQNGKFVVSTPFLYTRATVIKGLDQFGESLIRRSSKPSPVKENGNDNS